MAECYDSSGRKRKHNEILLPALILADILLVLPFIVKSVKQKEKIVKFDLSKQGYIDFIVLGLLLNVIVSGIVTMLPQDSGFMSEYTQIVGSVMTENFIATLLSAGILAPICEELVFRYGMIRRASNVNRAIFISALLFGVAHMNPVQSTYAFFLGLLFGYIYSRKFNLLHTIILHITVNSSSVIFDAIANEAVKNNVMLGVILFIDAYILFRMSQYFTKSKMVLA